MKKQAKNGKIPTDLKEDFVPEQIIYQPPFCSRYHESYKLKLELIWK